MGQASAGLRWGEKLGAPKVWFLSTPIRAGFEPQSGL